LATLYAGDDHVIFGLMNEPNSMPTEQWLSAANAAIAAIRAANAPNLILVPGNAWTGAHSWAETWYGSANAVTMLGVVDPMDRYAYEVHQYLDADSSGTNPDCPSATIGAERLQAFTTWARSNGYRAVLGEVGAASNATCDLAVAGALGHLKSNADVWAGWVWWAAGPWWGSYMYSIEPAGSTDKPQMAVLKPYLQ